MSETVSTSALVIIDMQEEAIRGLRRGGREEEINDMIDRLSDTLEAVRTSRKALILHVLHVPFTPLSAPFFCPPDWTIKSETDIASRSGNVSFSDVQQFAPLKAVTPREGEWMFVKPRFDMFESSEVVRLFVEQRIQEIFFMGIRSDMCIQASARSAMRNAFRPVVLSDCTTTNSKGKHEDTLWDMHYEGIEISSQAEFLKMFR